MDRQSLINDFIKQDNPGFSWSKYNKSQTQEKILFLRLLKELCSTIDDKKVGERIFCLAVKTYSIKSSRRVIGELELCKRAGYITAVPHFNTLLDYLKNKKIEPEIHNLIRISSFPLKSIETKFCGDSTGFGMSVLHDRWSAIRSQYQKHHKYLKAHLSFGVFTNIVTACRITEGTHADSPVLPELVEETAQNFTIKEYSWDKAYSSRDNMNKIFEKGGLPFIPFKSNTSGKPNGSMIWMHMYSFFQQNQELFMKKYHLRSNAESGMHMIKARFGDLTMMRNETGARNDVLMKILCHNICVLCQEIFLLGIEFNFAQLRRNAAQAQN